METLVPQFQTKIGLLYLIRMVPPLLLLLEGRQKKRWVNNIQEMDSSGVRQVPEGSEDPLPSPPPQEKKRGGERRKKRKGKTREESGCEVICGPQQPLRLRDR